MNKFNVLALTAAIALSFSLPSAFADSSKKDAKSASLDLAASHLKWTGKKVTGQHDGTLKLKSGKLEMNDKGEITGGDFVIDMTTIAVTDIKDPVDNKKLQGHLMSPDFFNVEAHPEATFKITSVKKMKSKSATHEITGELTVKEKTEKISFPVTVKMEKGMATAKGTLSVDRTKFDVRYGSGKFFENLGDKMISDNFDVALDLKAKM